MTATSMQDASVSSTPCAPSSGTTLPSAMRTICQCAIGGMLNGRTFKSEHAVTAVGFASETKPGRLEADTTRPAPRRAFREQRSGILPRVSWSVRGEIATSFRLASSVRNPEIPFAVMKSHWLSAMPMKSRMAGIAVRPGAPAPVREPSTQSDARPGFQNATHIWLIAVVIRNQAMASCSAKFKRLRNRRVGYSW